MDKEMTRFMENVDILCKESQERAEIDRRYKRLMALLGWPTDYYGGVTKGEAEIARRGLRDAYLDALVRLLGFEDGMGGRCDLGVWLCGNATPEDVFALLTAPPDVRVRAMLRALGEG